MMITPDRVWRSGSPPRDNSDRLVETPGGAAPSGECVGIIEMQNIGLPLPQTVSYAPLRQWIPAFAGKCGDSETRLFQPLAKGRAAPRHNPAIVPVLAQTLRQQERLLLATMPIPGCGNEYDFNGAHEEAFTKGKEGDAMYRVCLIETSTI